MTKMDMIWIAIARLIYPETALDKVVTRSSIENEVHTLFGETITPVMLAKHLVSWEDRQADNKNPKRGGSRNRYLFRTIDGTTPSTLGEYRLYKACDSLYDGYDKTGKVHPRQADVPPQYHCLVEWYDSHYFPMGDPRE